MSTTTKFAALALAALVSAGAIASSTKAEAKGPGPAFAVGAGLLGAAVVGSAIAANNGYYYNDDYRYRRCGWVRQYDGFGNYVGRVRTCDY